MPALAIAVAANFAPLAALATEAAPAAPLATAQLDVDGDGRPESVSLSRQGQLQIGRAAGGPLTAQLGLGTAGVIKTAALSLKQSEKPAGEVRRFVLAEAQLGDGTRRLLVVTTAAGPSGLATVYDGPVGPVGRDGEYAVSVEVTPDGPLRYQTAPGITRCDGEGRLWVERYTRTDGWRADPEVTLRALVSSAVPSSGTTATSTAPAGLSAQPLGVYRFAAASAQPGVQRADLLTAPRELEDGRATTSWQIPGEARGVFATARASGSGHAIRAVRIEPTAGGGPKAALPRQIALSFEPGAGTGPLLVNLNPAATGAQWVALPAPVTSRCISLVIVSPAATGTTALGEVAIYSELDLGTADATLPQLVGQAAAADSATADAALRTLLGVVEQRDAARLRTLLAAVDTTLVKATGVGRRRLHALLEGLSAAPAPIGAATVEPVLHALALAPTAERPPLWRLLERLGPTGHSALQRLAQDSTQPRELRADLLAHLGASSDARAVPLLLGLVPTASTDPGLRRGLVGGLEQALRCRPATDERTTAARGALAAPDAAARPAERAVLVEALGLAYAGCADAALRAGFTDALVMSWPAGSDAGTDSEPLFTLRVRILQGLARLGTPTAASLALLGKVLTEEREPVLRQLASRAATALPLGPENDPLARKGLGDSDAGVRLATVASLAGRADAETTRAVEKLAESDGWPQVRRAAIETRTAQCPPTPAAAPSLRARLDDADEQVQRMALAGVGRCEGPRALDLYTGLLKRTTAAPALRGQACALLARHGFSPSPLLTDAQRAQAHKDFGDALLDLLQEPEADERHAAAVQGCLRALGELGDERDATVLLQTAAAELPTTLRQAALESLGRLCMRSREPLPAAARKELAGVLSGLSRSRDGQGAGTDERLRAAGEKTARQCAGPGPSAPRSPASLPSPAR